MITYVESIACAGESLPPAAVLRMAMATEAIAAGDYVTVYDVAGATKMRLAIATDVDHLANGFVTEAAAIGEERVVYGYGFNAFVTGQTAGVVYLSATVAGKGTTTAPSVAQQLGFAIAATVVIFQRQPVAGGSGGGSQSVPVLVSGALGDGDLVNVYNNAGVANVRLASASGVDTFANGFVKSAWSIGQMADVFGGGLNDHASGMTAGLQYLSTTAGKTTITAPTTAGQIAQRVGFASAATALMFQPQTPFERA